MSKIPPVSYPVYTITNQKNVAPFNLNPQKTNGKTFPWLKNQTIGFALNALQNVVFMQEDVNYMNSMGIKLPFLSGKEAIDFLGARNVRIGFVKMQDDATHAQYDYEKNFIGINEKYQNTTDFPVILAISEAIFHEAGHAKDEDSTNSIQEELQCLALNVLANKYHKILYPQIFKDKNENIIKEGVELYSSLFFDEDKNKKALINRVREKYGFLPAGDDSHPACNLALNIKQTLLPIIFTPQKS